MRAIVYFELLYTAVWKESSFFVLCNYYLPNRRHKTYVTSWSLDLCTKILLARSSSLTVPALLLYVWKAACAACCCLTSQNCMQNERGEKPSQGLLLDRNWYRGSLPLCRFALRLLKTDSEPSLPV